MLMNNTIMQEINQGTFDGLYVSDIMNKEDSPAYKLRYNVGSMQKYLEPVGREQKIDVTMPAKIQLTDFLVEHKKTPGRDEIKEYYDTIVPDDWNKVCTIGGELLLEASVEENEAELKRLCTPVLSRVTYKYVTRRGELFRFVVEARNETEDFRMLVYSIRGGFWLKTEVIFSNCATDIGLMNVNTWYNMYNELMGLYDEGGMTPEVRRFNDYTYDYHDYFDEMFGITQSLLHNENLQEELANDVKEWIFTFRMLTIYMNHCIDIETEKKKALAEVDGEVKMKDVHHVKIVHEKEKKKDKSVIYVGDVVIRVGTTTKTKRREVLHRKCTCWGVRGHQRHYKNGKVVYIQPYKKGKERGMAKPIGKKYHLMTTRI